MIDWIKNLALWKKIVYPIILVAIIASAIIFIPKYNGPGENCTFLNEKANLHNEYYITVIDCSDCENISILKNKNDNQKTELIGTDKHFISVTIMMEHIDVSDEKESHVLDKDDFKLKDHTGVQLKNINLFSKENGVALENKNFSKKNAQIDYSWIDVRIEKGTSKTIVLYFEVPKNISTLDTVLVLEADLFSGRTNGNAGTDIVLAQRT